MTSLPRYDPSREPLPPKAPTIALPGRRVVAGIGLAALCHLPTTALNTLILHDASMGGSALLEGGAFFWVPVIMFANVAVLSICLGLGAWRCAVGDRNLGLGVFVGWGIGLAASAAFTAAFV
jgi:hypothetical protein